jgi:hypothetical protein
VPGIAHFRVELASTCSTTSDLIVNIGEKDEAAGMNDGLQASAVPSSSLLRRGLVLPTEAGQSRQPL